MFLRQYRDPAQALEELNRQMSDMERAEELISGGDLTGAKRELQMALREDGENPDLAERLDAIDLALYAMGQ